MSVAQFGSPKGGHTSPRRMVAAEQAAGRCAIALCAVANVGGAA